MTLRAWFTRLLIGRVFACVLVVASAALFAPQSVAAGTRTMEPPTVPVVIHYEPNSEKVARRVAEICEARMYGLGEQLGLAALPPVRVEIAEDITAYRSRHGGHLPRWGVAFALMGRGTMVVDVKRATQAWNSLEKVIPHELSHLLVAERLGGVPMPVWFLEGLAKWQADEWTMVDGWQLMNAVWSNQTPKLWDLQSGYPAGAEQARHAYRVSYAAFTYRFGDDFDRLPVFLDAAARSGDFNAAFQSVFAETPTAFYVRFHEHLESKYHSPLLVFQSGPLFSLLAALFLIVAVALYIRKYVRMRKMPDDPGMGPA